MPDSTYIPACIHSYAVRWRSDLSTKLRYAFFFLKSIFEYGYFKHKVGSLRGNDPFRFLAHIAPLCTRFYSCTA